VVVMMVVLMYRWQSGGDGNDGGADVQETKWWR
jgi:hypothetical protein